MLAHPFLVFDQRYSKRRLLAVALTELVYLLGGLQYVLLTGVERMGLARNFKLEQRVLLAVFPGDGFTRGYGRSRQNRKVGRDVLEDHVSVFGMYFWFHLGAAARRVTERSRILPFGGESASYISRLPSRNVFHLAGKVKVLCDQDFIKP